MHESKALQKIPSKVKQTYKEREKDKPWKKQQKQKRDGRYGE